MSCRLLVRLSDHGEDDRVRREATLGMSTSRNCKHTPPSSQAESKNVPWQQVCPRASRAQDTTLRFATHTA